MCTVAPKAFALTLMSLLLMLSACGEETCEVANTSCERSCEAGTYPICVAVGLCECSPVMNGGVMTGGVMTGGVMTGGSIEPPPTCAPPSFGDLILNEALVDPSGMEPQEEFIELVNTSDQELDLSGLTVAYEGNPKRVFTQGCMAPKSAVALFSEHSATQWSTPPRGVAFQALPQLSLANGRDASIELLDAQYAQLSTLYIPTSAIRSGVSATRAPELSGTPALHSEVSPVGAPMSPAQCSNMGTFEVDCADGQGAGGVMTGGVMTGGVMTSGVMAGEEGGSTLPLEGDPFGMIINEIDYDQPSTDDYEFIEVKNNGSTRPSLAGLTLELINGNGGAVYREIDLGEAGPSLDPGTFVVIGSSAIVDYLPLGIPVIVLPNSSLQNGPDGVRLTFQGQVVDELGYKGYTELRQVALEDDSDSDPDLSLSLCPANGGFVRARPSPARDNECIAP